jgi:branched-chain amino acid aminotransferase
MSGSRRGIRSVPNDIRRWDFKQTRRASANSRGQFFRLDDHIDRLLGACRKIRLEPPLDKDQIRDVMNEVVIRSGLRDAYVEIVVTRGVPGPGERDPRRWTPHVYAYAIPYVWIVRPEQQERGTDVIISTETYRIPPDSVDPTVTNFHWGDLVRGLFEAYDRGGLARSPHGP